MTLRIAMWSGPRNISTAMMRSFSSRPDCFVSDEPFYGAFLRETGADHPMADEVIAEPAGVLSQLCWALGINCDPAMLSWPGGPHPQDGVWASHWYGHVEASTGFEPVEPGDPPELEVSLQRVADACMDDYQHLSRFALRSAK